MFRSALLVRLGRIIGAGLAAVGMVGLVLAPVVGKAVFDTLWGVEPLAYIGAILVMVGLGVTAITFALPGRIAQGPSGSSPIPPERWSRVTQQYFELFNHDLGRPLRRILGKERELRAGLTSSRGAADPGVEELLAEIERQAPNFRLMMSNIQVLVEMEGPSGPPKAQAIEPAEVIRRIVDRYTIVATESKKEVSWWSEPAEFGIVYSDSSAIEHIVANLVDNAVRFAASHIEIKLTKNPSHFFIRVWDDGPGIAPQHLQHIFDRGWTPEVARREEKSSSGLGLFIARSLARHHGGDLVVESVFAPATDHHAAFLLSLPLGAPL